jgi:ubiquinone/menaquinone biosynthesis C-methylase UbiE
MKISLYSIFIDPLLRDLRKFVISFGEIKKGEKVLDVGCGTGDQALHFAKSGAIVAGIDISSEMIKTALEKKKKEKFEDILFQAADATDLPFLDPVFDVALISLVLHEIESKKRDKVISEMKRVVKKGGRLIFVDFNVPFPKTISAFFVKLIERFAGKGHHLNFQSYLKEGGLPALLERNDLKPEKVEYLKNKLLIAILAKNQ